MDAGLLSQLQARASKRASRPAPAGVIRIAFGVPLHSGWVRMIEEVGPTLGSTTPVVCELRAVRTETNEDVYHVPERMGFRSLWAG